MKLDRAASSDYRADIDGLRAVAVMAVILFHADPRWLPGGFVGVDIFFVISGYLITGIVAKDFEAGRFAFRQFYERRVRRILPALWVLLIVCVPLSWLLLLPQDAEAMGKSALWSALAMANVYFWHEVSTDYFAPQSAQLPFLHLWSLGVEEQFYLLWPMLLLAIWRLVKHRPRALGAAVALAVVVGSTLLAEYLLATQEVRFAYYMLPARAGELALGAGLALVRYSSFRGSATIAGVAAAMGWTLTGYSVVGLSEHDPFPGWRALVPTLGAAALILSGQLHSSGIWLSPLRSRVALWIGRCSYSAYLWHWPVLAWWRYFWGQPSTAESLVLVTMILVLARASQQWVEDPARLSRRPWLPTLLLYGIVPALIVATLGLLAARGERWGVPMYPQAQREEWAELESHTRPAHYVDWTCQQHVLDPKSLHALRCEFGPNQGPTVALLLGDSHAAQFAPLIRVAAEEQGVRVRSIALGSCAPLEGPLHGVVAAWRLQACEEGVPRILERARDFPLLIIGASWSNYASNEPEVWVRLETQLERLTARGQRVWLLPRVPEFAQYDAACPAKRARVGTWLRCPQVMTPTEDGRGTNARLAEIAQRVPGVTFLPLHETLCAELPCPLTDSEGRYLYADPSHLSVHGAQQLALALIQNSKMPDLNVALRSVANWHEN